MPVHPTNPDEECIVTDLELARTEYNAAAAELRHAQQRLDACFEVLVKAAERYGWAAALAGEEEVW